MKVPLKVFINPGHDRWLDPGACGNGLEEAEVVYDVCCLLETYLAQAGIMVVGNVQDDDLEYVCASANQSEADIFISVHCNAAENKQAHGTETFAFNEGSEGEKLASYIQDQIVNAIGTYDRGVKYARFYVLKYTDMPAVLVELAFISNELDALKLRYNVEDFAKAIARGVTDYQKHLLEGAD